MYLPNLTFVALPDPGIIESTPKICAVPGYNHAPFSVPEIIGGTQKIWAVPGYAHAPFSPKFFSGLCSDGPCEWIGQICSP